MDNSKGHIDPECMRVTGFSMVGGQGFPPPTNQKIPKSPQSGPSSLVYFLFQVLLSPSEDVMMVWPLRRQLEAVGDSIRNNCPRLVSISRDKIVCSPEAKDCLRMNQKGYCSHTLATSISRHVFETYVLSIQRKEPSLSKIPTKNLSPNVGKMKNSKVRIRKRKHSWSQQSPSKPTEFAATTTTTATSRIIDGSPTMNSKTM